MKKLIVMLCTISSLFFINPLLATTPTHQHAKQKQHSSVQKFVNLNKADKKRLMTLKGIGPKTAEKIIRYRQQHGKLNNLADLRKIPGFSDKRIRRLNLSNPDRIAF